MGQIPQESAAGTPTEVEHASLRMAASDSLPEQQTALGNTKQTASREVPAAAFSEMGVEASAGHNRNIGQIVDQMTGADQRYAAVIHGVGDTTRQFQQFDEEQAARQRQEQGQVELAQARRRQAVSQNGWPVNPTVRQRYVPGSSGTRLTFADGPAGDVLNHVAGQLQQRVESFDLDGPNGEGEDDWGYNDRTIRGSTTISNHASGTAFDLNATRHPLGASGTFTQPQVDEIHRILGEVDNVVRWGGDYTGRLDEMHFEIVGSQEEVARVAARIQLEIERTP